MVEKLAKGHQEQVGIMNRGGLFLDAVTILILVDNDV